MTKYNHTAPAPIIASQCRQSRQPSPPALKARHRLHPVSKPDPCCKTPQQQHLPETIPGLGTTIYKLRGRTRDKKQNTMSCGDKTLVLWSAQRRVLLPPRITPHRGSTSVAQPDKGQSGSWEHPKPRLCLSPGCLRPRVKGRSKTHQKHQLC